jgi:hypothetical protein
MRLADRTSTTAVLLAEHGDEGLRRAELPHAAPRLESRRSTSAARLRQARSPGGVPARHGWLLFAGDQGFDAQAVLDGIWLLLDVLARGQIRRTTRASSSATGLGPRSSRRSSPRLVIVAPAERGSCSRDLDLWDRVLRGLGIDPATLVQTTGVH